MNHSKTSGLKDTVLDAKVYQALALYSVSFNPISNQTNIDAR